MRILLISELSRLGRNVDEVLKNVMLCKERGLNVYFQKENLSIFDEKLAVFIAYMLPLAKYIDNIHNVINPVTA
jgi:DNA invertase Pin-like site-specific DNA recombinase